MKTNTFLIIAALLLCIHKQSDAQKSIAQAHAPVSRRDSTQVNIYLDSVGKCPLYSYRRQLYLDSALAIVPWNAYLWQQKAMPLFKQKKYEIGAVYLDSAVKYNPGRYLEYRAFMKCIFQKSYREAIRDFNSAKTMNGNSSVMDHSYDFYTGLCYLQLNQFDSSEYFIKRNIDNKFKLLGEDWLHPTELFYLGILQYEREEYAAAIETFDRCLKHYAHFCDAKYYKAICLESLNQRESALALATEAQQDFNAGKTFNEDNIYYEPYPYQVSRHNIEGYIKWLQKTPEVKK